MKLGLKLTGPTSYHFALFLPGFRVHVGHDDDGIDGHADGAHDGAHEGHVAPPF